MSNLKNRLIEEIKKAGADLVRFGNADRFQDKNVKFLFPNAKTVICIAARSLRGSRRGVEEGTTYHHFTTVGLETIEETILPTALLRVCNVLEDEGFEALPQRRNQLVMSETDSTNPEVSYKKIYRGRTAEHTLNFEQCAIDAGLGERSFHGSILTDDFGPFQRFAFVITDAEIEPDPVVEPHLCDKCGECAKACPGHAIDEKSGKLDVWQCAAYYVGANGTKNPFMPTYAFENEPERMAIIKGEIKLTPQRAREVIDQVNFYPPIRHAYCSSICGKACDTACYIHLEKKGALSKKFETPFRKRPEWHLSAEDFEQK